MPNFCVDELQQFSQTYLITDFEPALTITYKIIMGLIVFFLLLSVRRFYVLWAWRTKSSPIALGWMIRLDHNSGAPGALSDYRLYVFAVIFFGPIFWGRISEFACTKDALLRNLGQKGIWMLAPSSVQILENQFLVLVGIRFGWCLVCALGCGILYLDPYAFQRYSLEIEEGNHKIVFNNEDKSYKKIVLYSSKLYFVIPQSATLKSTEGDRQRTLQLYLFDSEAALEKYLNSLKPQSKTTRDSPSVLKSVGFELIELIISENIPKPDASLSEQKWWVNVKHLCFPKTDLCLEGQLVKEAGKARFVGANDGKTRQSKLERGDLSRNSIFGVGDATCTIRFK